MEEKREFNYEKIPERIIKRNMNFGSEVSALFSRCIIQKKIKDNEILYIFRRNDKKYIIEYELITDLKHNAIKPKYFQKNIYLYAVYVKFFMKRSSINLPVTNWIEVSNGSKMRRYRNILTGKESIKLIDKFGNRSIFDVNSFVELVETEDKTPKFTPKYTYDLFAYEEGKNILNDKIENVSRMARLYGVDRRTIYRWIDKFKRENKEKKNV